MTKTIYVDFLNEINKTQTEIMTYVEWWVHKKKIPVPRSEIVKALGIKNIPMATVRQGLNELLKKGYLREAYTISNKTSYVQLRGI